MRAEEYLDKIKKIEAMISNKEEEYKRLVALAEGIGECAVSERIMSSRDLHKSQKTIASYIDLGREIEDLKEKKKKILVTLEQLPTVEYTVLYRFFVQNYSLKEIAYAYRKSYEWAKKKKRNGLMLIQNMIDQSPL